MGSGVRLSVRLYACPVPRPNTRTERPRKPKISRTKVHHTSNLWTYIYIEVKGQSHQADLCSRSKCAISSEWECLWTIKLAHRRTTKTCITDKRHDLQGQKPNRKIMWCVWEVWPICREWNDLETPKLVGGFPTKRSIMRTIFKIKGQSQGRKVTWSVWCWLVCGERICTETPKLVAWLSMRMNENENV